MANKTIGQMLGTSKRTFSTKSHSDGVSVQITMNIDYSTCTKEDIIGYCDPNRVIAGQRWISQLSADEIKSLDGKTIMAKTAGTKAVMSRKELIERFMNLGVNEKEAERLADQVEKENQ
jgi:hypothetical protein